MACLVVAVWRPSTAGFALAMLGVAFISEVWIAFALRQPVPMRDGSKLDPGRKPVGYLLLHAFFTVLGLVTVVVGLSLALIGPQ